MALGTMTFGTDWGWGADEAESRKLFDAYVDRGGNFIDTANNYTNGTSERLVGKFARDRRERLVIATKYSCWTRQGDPNSGGNHRKSMIASLESSLRRLGIDYIDLLYLHVWDGTTPVEEILRGLDDLVRSGKVLYVGISDTPAWQISRMQAIAELRGWAPLVALQIEYSLIERTTERELIPMAREMGLGVLAWAPLAKGVLTGKYTRADLDRPDSTQTRKNLAAAAGVLSERGLAIADAVRAVAAEIGRTPAQVAPSGTRSSPASCRGLPRARRILGPGTDELTAVEHDAVAVYGLDGKLRRTAPLSLLDNGWTPTFEPGGRHLIIGSQSELSVFDCVTMTRRTIDKGGFANPVASDDGSLVAYLDSHHDVVLATGDGTTLRTIRTKNDPTALAVSATGDRIAVYTARSVTVYDRSGKEVTQFPIEGDQSTFIVRGDDTWFGGIDGVIRHFHEHVLVASLPNVPGQIEVLAVGGDTLAMITGDSALVMVDANAAQLVVDKLPCERFEPQNDGVAVSLMCNDGLQVAYFGHRKIGESHDAAMGSIAVDLASGRAAFAGETVTVVDRDGHQIAASVASRDPRGQIAFADPDHLLVLDLENKGLFRWELSTATWQHVADADEGASVAAVRGGWMIGFIDGHVALFRDGHEVHRVALGARADYLAPSDDGSYVAAQLGNGGTAILDGKTGELVRMLATADSVGLASVLDPTSELRDPPQPVVDHALGPSDRRRAGLDPRLAQARASPRG